MVSKILLSMILTLLGVLAAPAEAFTIHQSADMHMRGATVDPSRVFTLNIETASANGAVLHLGGEAFLQSFTGKDFTDEFVISKKVQAKTFGDWSAGIVYGNRRFIFHPGFPGGGFQIENAIDSNDLINRLDMGFTPSNIAIHKMTISWTVLLKQLTVTIVDGADAANSFVFVWTPDDGFDPTGLIGNIYHDGNGRNP